jgi:hypothetical protein
MVRGHNFHRDRIMVATQVSDRIMVATQVSDRIMVATQVSNRIMVATQVGDRIMVATQVSDREKAPNDDPLSLSVSRSACVTRGNACDL